MGDRVRGVGAYPGSRWLVPLVFTFPSDMAVWLTELGCLCLRWGSSKVVGVCRLGAGLQFPSPGLAQGGNSLGASMTVATVVGGERVVRRML